MRWIPKFVSICVASWFSTLIAASILFQNETPNMLTVAMLFPLIAALIELRLLHKRLYWSKLAAQKDDEIIEKLSRALDRAQTALQMAAKLLPTQLDPIAEPAVCWTCGTMGPRCTAHLDEHNRCALPVHPGSMHHDGDRLRWKDN